MTTETSTGRTDQAKDEGKQLLDEAKEKTGDIRREAMREGRQVIDDVRGRVKEQADEQGRRAASSLRGVAGQLGSMAEASGQDGAVVDLARDGAQKIERLADRLEHDGVQGVIDDVEGFARQRPGLFLAAGFGLGFVLARIVRAGDPNGTRRAVTGSSQGTASELHSSPRPATDGWPTERPLGTEAIPANSPLSGDLREGTARP